MSAGKVPIPNKPGASNWVEAAGGLPSYIRRIAEHIHGKGHDTSSSIAMAVNTVKRWCAAGSNHNGGKITAKTKALACKAVGSWEAKKAKSGARAIAEAVRSGIFLTPAEQDEMRAAFAGRLVLAEGLLESLGSGRQGTVDSALELLEATETRPKLKLTFGGPEADPLVVAETWERLAGEVDELRALVECLGGDGPPLRMDEGNVAGHVRHGARGKLVRVKSYMKKDGGFDVDAIRAGTPKHIDVNPRADGESLSVWVPGEARSAATVSPVVDEVWKGGHYGRYRTYDKTGKYELSDSDGAPMGRKHSSPESAVDAAVAYAHKSKKQYKPSVHASVGGPVAGYDDEEPKKHKLSEAARGARAKEKPAKVPDHEKKGQGPENHRVAALQRRLASLGHELSDDGDFGPTTDGQVRDFQRNANLKVDGVVGPVTTEALRNAPGPDELAQAEAEMEMLGVGQGDVAPGQSSQGAAPGENVAVSAGSRPGSSTSGNPAGDSSQAAGGKGTFLIKGMGVGDGANAGAVKALQDDLGHAGVPLEVDGAFGPETEKGVKRFQRKWGLKADGIAGPKTARALKRATGDSKALSSTAMQVTEARRRGESTALLQARAGVFARRVEESAIGAAIYELELEIEESMLAGVASVAAGPGGMMVAGNIAARLSSKRRLHEDPKGHFAMGDSVRHTGIENHVHEGEVTGFHKASGDPYVKNRRTGQERIVSRRDITHVKKSGWAAWRARHPERALREASVRGEAHKVVASLKRLPDGTFAPAGRGQVLKPGMKVSVPHKDGGGSVPGVVKSGHKVALLGGPDQGTDIHVTPDAKSGKDELGALDSRVNTPDGDGVVVDFGGGGDGSAAPYVKVELDDGDTRTYDKSDLLDAEDPQGPEPDAAPDASAGGMPAPPQSPGTPAPPESPGSGGMQASGKSIKDLPLGTTVTLADGKQYIVHKSVKEPWMIIKPVDGGKAKPMHGMAPAVEADTSTAYDAQGAEPDAVEPVSGQTTAGAMGMPTSGNENVDSMFASAAYKPAKSSAGSAGGDISDSPGRGPTGKLRNFKAMNKAKLLGVIDDLEGHGGDPEALDAAMNTAVTKGFVSSSAASTLSPLPAGQKLTPVKGSAKPSVKSYDPKAGPSDAEKAKNAKTMHGSKPKPADKPPAATASKDLFDKLASSVDMAKKAKAKGEQPSKAFKKPDSDTPAQSAPKVEKEATNAALDAYKAAGGSDPAVIEMLKKAAKATSK